MGFFCGVSEGIKLPKVMDSYLEDNDTEDTKELRYKEVVFITGKPLVFSGRIEVSKSGEVDPDAQSGTYSKTYVIGTYDDDPIQQEVNIAREVTFNVNYRKVGNQILKNYELDTWEETINVGQTTYTLDARNSIFNNTIIEYSAPGIRYYKGSIGYRATYKNNDAIVTVNVTGNNALYGYDQFWGKTETQLLKVLVESKSGESGQGWKLEAEVKPSITVNKTLQYDTNKPEAIGFGGNYLQITQNESGMTYKVTMVPSIMDYIPKEESVSIPSYNSFEHLVAPENTGYLAGSFAEDDIKKLYSLEVLDSRFAFVPNEKLTRAQYVTLLVKALGLDQKYKGVYEGITVFGDVDSYHPHYENITIGYKTGLVRGTNGGNFQPDKYIKREEAFVIYMRSLGLSRLGQELSPMTPFTDDLEIATWAKKDIHALYNLNLIRGDSVGRLRPKDEITKAEGAAITNRLINYLRKDIKKDYVEKLIQY